MGNGKKKEGSSEFGPFMLPIVIGFLLIEMLPSGSEMILWWLNCIFVLFIKYKVFVHSSLF